MAANGRLCEACLLKIARCVLLTVEQIKDEEEKASNKVMIVDDLTGIKYNMTVTLEKTESKKKINCH